MTAGSFINRASIRLYEICGKEGIPFKMILQVHDQIVLETDEKYGLRLSEILQDCMENTCKLPGVKLEAIPAVGKTLGDF
jgi:DNA polymerase I-like protein with 3'-5' exonuclease and polymerase domains